jgi:hypothetical protein
MGQVISATSYQAARCASVVMQSKGDLIFFLDADDVYAPNYLETSVSVYKHNKDCEFLFCRKIDVGRYLPPDLFEIKQPAETKVAITDLGFSLVRTLEEKVWIGAPTSCLSIHRRLAKRLFPFPLPVHEDWRIRADDCIVFGASLAGCRKFRLETSLVRYRIHGNNAWVNNKHLDKPNAVFLRQVSIARRPHRADEAEQGRLLLQWIGRVRQPDIRRPSPGQRVAARQVPSRWTDSWASSTQWNTQCSVSAKWDARAANPLSLR